MILGSSNLLIILKILIFSLFIFIGLIIFSYIYYRISSKRNLKRIKISKLDAWPLIFPYITSTIIWIIMYLTQQNNADNIWIYYNIYYLTFDLILSIIFLWWYIIVCGPIYIIFLSLSLISNSNSFNNPHFFISFIIIFIFFSLVSLLIHLLKDYNRYILYILILIGYTVCAILNYNYMYNGNYLYKSFTITTLTVCFFINLLSFYLNRKINKQTRAIFTLSRNIGYDYDYFFNKANSIYQIKKIINQKNIKFLNICVFNAKLVDEYKFKPSEVDINLRKFLHNFIKSINDMHYISFITFNNNFAIAFYNDNKTSINKFNNQTSIFAEKLHKASLFKINDKNYKFNITFANTIYGLENNIIEETIRITDKKIKIKLNKNIQEKHFTFIVDDKNQDIKNEVKKFIDEHNLKINLIKQKFNNLTYYFTYLKFLNPLNFNQMEVNKLINEYNIKTYIWRYISYSSFIKYINVRKENDSLFLTYPIIEFIQNQQSLINLFDLLNQYKVKNEEIIFLVNLNENISISDLKIAILYLKKYNFKIALSFPDTIKKLKLILKNSFLVSLFNYLIISINNISSVWPNSFNKKIEEFLNYINSNQEIIYY